MNSACQEGRKLAVERCLFNDLVYDWPTGIMLREERGRKEEGRGREGRGGEVKKASDRGILESGLIRGWRAGGRTVTFTSVVFKVYLTLFGTPDVICLHYTSQEL